MDIVTAVKPGYLEKFVGYDQHCMQPAEPVWLAPNPLVRLRLLHLERHRMKDYCQIVQSIYLEFSGG